MSSLFSLLCRTTTTATTEATFECRSPQQQQKYVHTTEHFIDLDDLDLVKLVYGFNRFLLLPKLPIKITLNFKVVKSDSKIIILLLLPKSVTHSVLFLNKYFSIGRRKKSFSAFLLLLLLYLRRRS